MAFEALRKSGVIAVPGLRLVVTEEPVETEDSLWEEFGRLRAAPSTLATESALWGVWHRLGRIRNKKS